MIVYTIKEVADLLKVGESTVRKLIASGEMPYSKVLGQYRVRPEQLDDYLKKVSNEEYAQRD